MLSSFPSQSNSALKESTQLLQKMIRFSARLILWKKYYEFGLYRELK